MNEKASAECYSTDFEKSLETLEDIQLLSEFSISPLVSNAYFYLSEMKRKADLQASGQLDQFESVLNVLDEKLKWIIEDFFGNKTRFKSFDYYKTTDNITLKKWNQVLESIPEILSVVGLFNYHGQCEVRFDDNRFQVSGLILEDGRFDANRKLIYVITKKLLRNKVLLTFNLEKTARAGVFKLTLKADFSHDEKMEYRANFSVDQIDYVIGFSNVFSQYRTELENLQEVGEHTIVEIHEDLSVHSRMGVVELTRRESDTKEILHFPFIFRPLSIILPVKGQLSFITSTKNLDDENKRKQDVSKQFRTIDFFSLFNL
jgi:hypothetical protein